MGQARVVRRFDAPASAVWDLVSWRGMARLAGGSLFETVSFEQADMAVGATKRLHLATGDTIRERLEWLDEPGMGYGYRIIDGGGLPVTDYTGHVRVTAAGPDACTVIIRCEFAGVTVEDEDFRRQWQEMESGVLDAVATRLACASVTPSDIAAIIRARSDLFEADFASGDAARLVANYYTDTPRVIMPDSPMLSGRAAITAMFAELMKVNAACRLHQVDVYAAGDLAYELSEATVTPRDPAAPVLAVRYIIIWRRVAGEWRVSIDFFGWGDLAVAAVPGS
ncbi:SRPBCC family protein [Niveispirillum fermenti]|uniref:SRPBCC family protein n=1 Tax=Niveispirillum fermenti TaxID=1233113 RepID=UPI003A848A9B